MSMTALNPLIDIGPSNRTPLPGFDVIETSSPKKSIKAGLSAKKAFNTFSKKWKYIDKAIIVSRLLISIILDTGDLIAQGYAKLEKGLSSARLHLNFFSVINIPICISSIHTSVASLWKNIRWKDNEGMALSSILLSITIAELFDDVTTIMNAISEAFSGITIGWIEKVVVPLGIAVSSASAIIKGNHLYQLSKFNRDFNRNMLAIESQNSENEKISSENLRTALAPFLKSHLGPENNKNKALSALKRHTSEPIANKMAELQFLLDTHLTLGDQEIDKILNLLKGIKSLLASEKKLQTGLLVASIISMIASSLLLTPLAPVAAYTLLGIALITQLSFKFHHSKELKAIET